MSAVPARIVLDTNVCLDLFVFRDPWCRPLQGALEAGTLEAVTREDCRDEWLRVLGYPQFKLDEAGRERATVAFDALVRKLATIALEEGTVLPLCEDPDDQKFLELAWTSGASMLLTKDKALLALSRRELLARRFAILAPAEWTNPAVPAR
jgi:putative PIN family toxin of toxin-antitoxin system